MDGISGDIKSGIYLYDIDSTFTEGCNFTGISPFQRVRVCFEMDKQTYLDGIFANDFAGTFDTNLVSATACLSDTAPINGQAFPSLGQTIQSLLVLVETDDATTYRACAEFRVKEEWANLLQNKYVTFKWHFKYTDGTGSVIEDIIRRTVCFSFKKIDTGSEIGFNGVYDEDGTSLTRDGFFCDTYDGMLYPRFNLIASGDYTQIAYQIASNGSVDEQNDHTSELLQLDANAIISGSISPVNPITTGGAFEFCIDASKIETDEEACFAVTLIKETALTPIVCPCIDIELNQVVNQQNTSQTVFDTTFTITGVAAADVQFINFDYPNGMGNGVPVPTNSQTLTGTVTLIVFAPETTVEYIANITLADGCQYSIPVTLSLSNDVATVSSCEVDTCNLGWSAEGTGSVLIVEIGGVECRSFQSATTAAFEACIENLLMANGFIFSDVIVQGTPPNQITGLQITGTNLTLSDIENTSEDDGLEKGISTCDFSPQICDYTSAVLSGASTINNILLQGVFICVAPSGGFYTVADWATVLSCLTTKLNFYGYTFSNITYTATGNQYQSITIEGTNIIAGDLIFQMNSPVGTSVTNCN